LSSSSSESDSEVVKEQIDAEKDDSTYNQLKKKAFCYDENNIFLMFASILCANSLLDKT
jgi:hypothetical protein